MKLRNIALFTGLAWATVTLSSSIAEENIKTNPSKRQSSTSPATTSNKSSNNNPPQKATVPTKEDMLFLGKSAGNEKNYGVALKIYNELAEQGVPEAHYRLGEMYTDGTGVDKDDEKGMVSYKKAADLNFPYALEIVYKSDPKLLFDRMLVLAESGNPDAQILLVGKYISGKGVARSTDDADKWINRSLAQAYCGDEFSFVLEMLGARYELGLGVPRDSLTSLSLRKKAVGCGNAQAATSIGKMYFSGNGLRQDQDEAAKWFSKAIILGGAREEKSIERFLKLQQATDRLFAEIERLPKRSIYGWRTGMTKEQVLQSSNERPIRKNKFTTSSGTQEQWVYGSGWAYLYFNENGILLSYQERETQ